MDRKQMLGQGAFLRLVDDRMLHVAANLGNLKVGRGVEFFVAGRAYALGNVCVSRQAHLINVLAYGL